MRTTSYTLLFTLAPALLALLSPLVVSHPLQTTTQPGLVGPWRKTVPARSLHSPMPGPTADTARPGHWEGDELSRRLKSEESGGDQRIKPLLPRDKYSSLSPLSSSRETAGVSASGETSQGSFTVRQTRQVSLVSFELAVCWCFFFFCVCVCVCIFCAVFVGCCSCCVFSRVGLLFCFVCFWFGCFGREWSVTQQTSLKDI